MSFKRPLSMKEGNHFVEVTNVRLLAYEDEKEALKLIVKTIEGTIIYGNFLIFTSNAYLIDKLINIAYENPPDDEIDEQEFVGIYMEITTKEKNGYLNIVDINPVEVEYEDEEEVEEEQQFQFGESDDLEV